MEAPPEKLQGFSSGTWHQNPGEEGSNFEDLRGHPGKGRARAWTSGGDESKLAFPGSQELTGSPALARYYRGTGSRKDGEFRRHDQGRVCRRNGRGKGEKSPPCWRPELPQPARCLGREERQRRWGRRAAKINYSGQEHWKPSTAKVTSKLPELREVMCRPQVIPKAEPSATRCHFSPTKPGTNVLTRGPVPWIECVRPPRFLR